MLKNLLFSLKKLPNAGGSAPRHPLQSTYILNSSLYICPQKHRLSRNQPKDLIF